jgi:hypothetical protein
MRAASLAPRSMSPQREISPLAAKNAAAPTGRYCSLLKSIFGCERGGELDVCGPTTLPSLRFRSWEVWLVVSLIFTRLNWAWSGSYLITFVRKPGAWKLGLSGRKGRSGMPEERRNEIARLIFDWCPRRGGNPALSGSGTLPSGSRDRHQRLASRVGYIHLPSRLLLGARCLCSVRQN